MDIDSLNGGSVESKGWLNPTVGTLRAKKIICDDIGGSSGIPTIANLGWSSTTPPPFLTTIPQDEARIFPDASPSPRIPVLELTTGSVWELYSAGVISPLATNVGVLTMGVSLHGILGSTIDDKICVVNYSNSANSPAQFEFHGTFRVLNDLTPGNLLDVTHVGKLVTKRNNDGAVQTDIVTTYKTLAFAPDTAGEIGVYFCAASAGATFLVSRTVTYLRRIA